MKIINQTKFEKIILVNTSKQAIANVQFMIDWANLMEKKIAAGEKLTDDFLMDTAKEISKTNNISILQLAWCSAMLNSIWAHGPELDKVIRGMPDEEEPTEPIHPVVKDVLDAVAKCDKVTVILV